MKPLLHISYTAGAAIAARRILKCGAADGEAIQATSGAAALLGISADVAVASGGQVDAYKVGIAPVELGGTVTRGDWLTADANGKAVAAVIVAGSTLYVIGQAEVSGVSGDIIDCDVRPTVIGNDTQIYQADVTITAAQLKALNATPKQLVAAPGAGIAVVLVDYQAFMDYATTQYDGIAAGEDIALRYTDGSGQIVAEIEAAGFLDQASDQFRQGYPLADGAKTPVANAALVAHMKSGEIATGDSPLKLRLRYRLVATSF